MVSDTQYLRSFTHQPFSKRKQNHEFYPKKSEQGVKVGKAGEKKMTNGINKNMLVNLINYTLKIIVLCFKKGN